MRFYMTSYSSPYSKMTLTHYDSYTKSFMNIFGGGTRGDCFRIGGELIVRFYMTSSPPY